MNEHERAQFEREGRIAKALILLLVLLVLVPVAVVLTVGLPLDGH